MSTEKSGKIRSGGFKSSRGTRFGKLERVFDDVWWTWGTTRFMPGVVFPRNMSIIRRGDELTVIHPVMMPDDVQREIEDLGTIRHIVRLGAFHGMDDGLYVERYQPTVWAPADVNQAPGVTTDHVLKPGCELPFEDATIFEFEASKASELTLVYRRHGGILFTCDSIQSWETTESCSLLGGVMARVMGFRGRVCIGPGWRKLCEPEPPGFGPEFHALLEHDFAHLISGHGKPVKKTAKADLRERVNQLYP